MVDTFTEFARIYARYGQEWAKEFRMDRGEGWELFREHPGDTETFNRIFLEHVNAGDRVYAEFRTGLYYIWIKPKSELAPVPTRAESAEVFRAFTDMYRKHGNEWKEQYRKDLGKGWQRAGTAEGDVEFQKVFVDYARKGYMVIGDYPYGPVGRFYYIVYVKPKSTQSTLAVREYAGYGGGYRYA